MPSQFKLHLHFTISPKHDNICKVCLWMPEEHKCLILTAYIKYLLHSPRSLERNNIETFGLHTHTCTCVPAHTHTHTRTYARKQAHTHTHAQTLEGQCSIIAV